MTETIERYLSLFVIAVEGDVTEKSYFEHFQKHSNFTFAGIEIIRPNSKSAPNHVLAKLKQYKKTNAGNYRFWLVIDEDERNKEELKSIYQQCKDKNIGFAISSPAFEFWLLLHFCKGNNIKSVSDCTAELKNKKYLLSFDKHISKKHWETLYSRINTAISNAKELESASDFWRQNKCGSTVYKLVLELLEYTLKPK